MRSAEERRPSIPAVPAVKFMQRSNGTIKGYAVNTFHGLAKNYNQDRVSIIMNITKPNYKGRWPRCSYFGVFDGHGGNRCSDFLKENMHKYITQNAHFPHEPIDALKYGFRKAEQEFIAYAEAQNPIERSGSCAIVVLIIDEICYVANVGDSRAILSAHCGQQIYSISKDHKPDSDTERERILAAGGKIYQSAIKQKNGGTLLGPFRIEPGKLSVSRSFGDIEAKLQKYDGNSKVLIAKPEITYFTINADEHDFIIMGSDGVYDKLTNQEVAECFWGTRKEARGQGYTFIGAVSSRIIQRSMERMSMDNLTSLLIVFEDNGKLLLPPKNMQEGEVKNYKDQRQRLIEAEVENKNRSNFSSLNQTKRKGQISSREQRRGDTVLSQRQPLDKFLKRKSSHNLLMGINEKRSQIPLQNSHSLNNSQSSKILGNSTKNSGRREEIKKQEGRVKQQTGKVNINELLLKKKIMDNAKKEKKESLWKQLSSVNRPTTSDNSQKLIRF